MKSNALSAIALFAISVLSPAASLAGTATSDKGYTVDPCYKQCGPLLSSVTPRQEAVRVYKNCFAGCNHKGLVTCPNGAKIRPGNACP